MHDIILLGDKKMNALFLLKSKGEVAYLIDMYTIEQGLVTMREKHYTAIPVITHDGDYVGCISEGDFLWYIVNPQNHARTDVPIRQIMRKDYNPAVKIDVSMEGLLERIKVQNFVPVVDDRNKFIGIITRKDVICYFQNYIEKMNEAQ